jgi:hypothetical protein
MYIPAPDDVTPKWLTAVLRQSGVVGPDEVTAVEIKTTDAFNSRTSHLLLAYSSDALPDAPTRLVLKRNVQETWGMEDGEDEVKFYNYMKSLSSYPPAIVPCYAAAYDKESGNSYILLQDLSATHQPPVTRDQQIRIVEGVPPVAYIEAVVDALAQLDASWWEHPLLQTDVFEVGYWSRDAERFHQYLQRRTASWISLIAQESAWFPDYLRELYEQVLAHLPGYWKRYVEPRFRAKSNLTLVHGDAYFANFLCPKVPGDGATYLLDWQSYSFDIGAYDLVNLCATFWTPEQRHEDQREEQILRRYFTGLQTHGVKNYSWDDLLTDYRMGLIFWIFMPVQDCFGGSNKDYWLPKMQCLTSAFREWHCEKLLSEEAIGEN